MNQFLHSIAIACLLATFPVSHLAVASEEAPLSITLPAETATISGELGYLGIHVGAIGFWHNTQDTAMFQIEDLPAGRYELSMVYGGDPICSGGVLLLTLNGKELRHTVVPTKAFRDFQETEIGEMEHGGGSTNLILRAEEMVGDAFMDLKSLTLRRMGGGPSDDSVRTSGIISTAQNIPTPAPKSGTLLQPLQISLTENGVPIQPVTLPPGTRVPVSRWETTRALIRHASGEYWLSLETRWEIAGTDDVPSSAENEMDRSVAMIEIDAETLEAESEIRDAFERPNAPALLILNRHHAVPLLAEQLEPDFLVLQTLPVQTVESAAMDADGHLFIRAHLPDGTPISAKRSQSPQIAPNLPEDGILRLSENPLDDTAAKQAVETPPTPTARQGPTSTPPRPLSSIFDRDKAAPLLADDFTDPQNRRFLSRPTKEMHYRDGRLVVEPGHHMALPNRQVALENFAAEMVGRASFETHRCWAVGIHGEVGPPGNRNNPRYAFRVSLSSEGNLRLATDLTGEQDADDSDWPNVGPIPVRNFRPNEFNTLTVVFTEGQKVAVFVNDIEAIEPITIPVRLLPATMRFFTCVANDPGATVEFDSFRIFSEIPTEKISSN